ncbi:MAG TPA: metallophosphoesterase [Alphaproteobacteria bacterium]|nr:metallophosphoesterase [Alphaproteobacteria bacterium]
MIISRAGFLRGLVAGAVLPASPPGGTAGLFLPDGALDSPVQWTGAPKAGLGPLRFAVIGDNTGIARPGVFAQAMVQLSWLEPDFVVSVGDLIEGYTYNKAEISRQWQAVERSIAKLGCPFVAVPGNHDTNTPETVAAWRERRGSGYYAFTYKGALFLMLSTEDPALPMPPKMAAQFYEIVDMMKSDPDKAEKMVDSFISSAMKSGGTSANIQSGEYSGELNTARFSDRQLAFVRDALAQNADVRWTFVIMHKPAWKTPTPALAKIQAMLGSRPYTVFAGHTHYFTHDLLDGRDYINMGMTGGIRHQMGPGAMDHAMLVTLGPTGPLYANTRLNGLMDVAGETGQPRAY